MWGISHFLYKKQLSLSMRGTEKGKAMAHTILKLYVIVDKLADQIVGDLVTPLKADVQAVRMFTDVLERAGNPIAKHPNDYDLVRLGFIDEDNNLCPDYAVVMTGAAWLALQQPKELGD